MGAALKAPAALPPQAAVTARAVGGPPPDANNALPLLARIQRLDTSSLHKFADLNLAENELNSYCCRLAPDGGMEKCWQAYSFLERKREAAAAGCDVADPTCLELEKLNTMAHDLLATGSVSPRLPLLAGAAAPAAPWPPACWTTPPAAAGCCLVAGRPARLLPLLPLPRADG